LPRVIDPFDVWPTSRTAIALRSKLAAGAACWWLVAVGCTSRAPDQLFGDTPVTTVQGTGGSVIDASGGDPRVDASAGAAGAGGGQGGGAAGEGGATGGSDGRDVVAPEASSADGTSVVDATTEPPGPTCGNEQQDCCPGAKCNAPFTICNNGKCAACGAHGATCCPDFGCRNSGCCSNSVCVANGGNCEMNPSSNLCHDGACRDCGTEGRSCCGSQFRTCGQGLACVSGSSGGSSDQCVKCGAVGQACCGLATARFCNGELVCSGGLCQVCGVANGPCCPGDKCDANMVCDTDKTCKRCGSATELCCQKDGKAVCNDGFLCGKDNHCTRCGARGEACCEGRKCTAGVCIRSGDAEACQNDCGAQGQPCCKVMDCPGGQCDGCVFGLDCDLATSQCVNP
jgi:hypothetical protein